MRSGSRIGERRFACSDWQKGIKTKALPLRRGKTRDANWTWSPGSTCPKLEWQLNELAQARSKAQGATVEQKKAENGGRISSLASRLRKKLSAKRASPSNSTPARTRIGRRNQDWLCRNLKGALAWLEEVRFPRETIGDDRIGKFWDSWEPGVPLQT